MKKILLLLAAIAFFTKTFSQQIADGILHKRWQASWITVANTPEHDYGVYHFRKTFTLAGKPNHFVVHVSGDNRYKLFVNGVQVAFGPARCDVYNWNFETVDIAPELQPGNNSIAAVVWNFGDERQEAQISYQTGFIMQGNSAVEAFINTNKTWKCIQDKAYSPLHVDLPYYYAAGPTEKIDYNQYPAGWEQTSYNDAQWQQASELWEGLPKGVFNYSVGWMLVPRPIPAMELTMQQLKSVRLSTGITVGDDFLQGGKSFTVAANTKVSLLLDQSFLTTAFPVLHFSRGKNSVIDIGYAEALYVDEPGKGLRGQNQKGNRNDITGKHFMGIKDEVVANGDDNQTFSPLAYRTYRYVKVDIVTNDEPLTINDFYGMYTGYPFTYNAAFASSDETLNKILETGWHTARLDAQETYMDCPYYEQLQYIGDTRIQALVSLYNSGDDRLVRNAITETYNSLMPEGITLSRYPTSNAQEIPTFSLIWIGMLHDYWMYRGDADFVKQNLQASRTILNFFHRYQQDDGSLRNVPYWIFTDWCGGTGWHDGIAPIGKDGSSALLDLQLLMAYEVAADMENKLGMPAFAENYTRQAALLKQTIQKNYWDAGRGLYADTRDKDCFSQHTSSLAILTGVEQGAAATATAEKIMADTTPSRASIYFRYYVYRAYNKAGLGNKYLDQLGIWRQNLAMGMTTWGEIDDINRTRSDCHAWGSSPNIELFRIVLGIESDAPGFEKVRIEPHLGYLTNASGSIPHPAGKISAAYEYNAATKKWKVALQLPSTITGTFVWKGKEYPLKSGETKIEVE